MYLWHSSIVVAVRFLPHNNADCSKKKKIETPNFNNNSQTLRLNKQRCVITLTNTETITAAPGREVNI